MSSPAREPLVHIVVLNWNGWEDTDECLRSLVDLDYPNHRIVVVDNASTDGSDSRIRTAWPEVTLVPVGGANRGFAGGCNVGIRHAVERGATYIWLLNNDTSVVPGSLTALVRMAEATPSGRFFGSWISRHDDPDVLLFGGGGYGRWTGSFRHDLDGERASRCGGNGEIRTTSWITGCSLLVRASGLDEIGLLDETYFLYREELEWQLRRDPRRPLAHLIAAPLVSHKVGGTGGGPDGTLGTIFMARNYLKLTFSHAGLAMPLWLMRWLRWYVLRPVMRRDPDALRCAIRAMMLLRTPGEVISQRYGRDRPAEAGRP